MINPKYTKLLSELTENGRASMKVFGNSMTPIIYSGSVLTFEMCNKPELGDVVFCKVHGRYIDAHKVTCISDRGYLISNNHGHDNGWTKQIFGKVVAVNGKVF